MKINFRKLLDIMSKLIVAVPAIIDAVKPILQKPGAANASTTTASQSGNDDATATAPVGSDPGLRL